MRTMASSRFRLALFVVVASVPTVAGAACQGDDPESIVEEAVEQDQPQIVLGERFEGTAPVGEVLSPHAFRLLDTLVVTPTEPRVAEGVRFVVRGTVRRWDPPAIEKELGLDFDDAVEDADDELVVVADHVEEAPEMDEPGER